MALKQDIAAERIKMYKSVYKSKLSKFLAKKYLDPVLKELEKSEEEIYNIIGIIVVKKLRAFLKSQQPQGKKYQVREAGSGKGRKANILIESYTASAQGQPPAEFSGTLNKEGTIDYKIEAGHIIVGVFKSPGTEFETHGFYSVNEKSNKKMAQQGFSGIIYAIPGGAKATPVTSYANILDKGRSGFNGEGFIIRPWFRHIMLELRPYIREIVRKNLKDVLNRTRIGASSEGRAIVFKVLFTSLQGSGSDFSGSEEGIDIMGSDLHNLYDD